MTRFSLRRLLLAVAAIGVAVTAFLNANDYWAAAASIVLLLSLAAAIICLAARRNNAFCAAYCGVTLVVLLASHHGLLGNYPVLTVAVDYARSAYFSARSGAYHDPNAARSRGYGSTTVALPAGTYNMYLTATRDEARTIGYAAIAMSCGLAAGAIAQAIAPRPGA
ncbi:MAG: hypothetical protein U0836_25830 [Pirellulales bacterium]